MVMTGRWKWKPLDFVGGNGLDCDQDDCDDLDDDRDVCMAVVHIYFIKPLNSSIF